MQNALKLDRVRRELPGVFMTLGLVAMLTALLFALVWEMGLAHGSVVFLIPVVIAATRWGVISAVVAAICGVVASAFFFYEPLYSFRIKDPQEVIDLILFIFVAVAVSQLATRLKWQLEMARQREIDLRDLYAFSRRLAVAFDVSDIHAAIEDHLANIMQRNVVLFASAREASNSSGRRAGVTVPERVLTEAIEVASGHHDTATGAMVTTESDEIWLVRAVSPKAPEFGVIAINLGRESKERSDELRIRVDAVLADATATLERLGVAHAINEARMRSQTDQLREALIGSVSHELRTPLASILGAATVLSAAPALQKEKKLTALVHDVRDEAETTQQRHPESARCDPHQQRWRQAACGMGRPHRHHQFGDRALPSPPRGSPPHGRSCRRTLPLIYVDPVLVQQALIQIFDNAVKYSASGTQITVGALTRDGRLIISVTDHGAGLTTAEKTKIWDRFARGERHAATTSGSGLGLWIANAFIAANDGRVSAVSEGPGLGTTVSIELPVTQAAVPQMESDADE